MNRLYSTHPEYRTLGIIEGINHVFDEIKEFVNEPSKDEFSDICYGINRLIGAFFKKRYIGILPFCNMHIEKCNKRYLEYGHFRSKRHLS